jgi:small subunit ribosomal protein S17
MTTDKAMKLEFEGIDTSDRMYKTVVVTVERPREAPGVRKYVRRRSKFKAHDERNECRQGDKVLNRECRPLSRKRAEGSEDLERQE